MREVPCGAREAVGPSHASKHRYFRPVGDLVWRVPNYNTSIGAAALWSRDGGDGGGESRNYSLRARKVRLGGSGRAWHALARRTVESGAAFDARFDAGGMRWRSRQLCSRTVASYAVGSRRLTTTAAHQARIRSSQLQLLVGLLVDGRHVENVGI